MPKSASVVAAGVIASSSFVINIFSILALYTKSLAGKYQASDYTVSRVLNLVNEKWVFFFFTGLFASSVFILFKESKLIDKPTQYYSCVFCFVMGIYSIILMGFVYPEIRQEDVVSHQFFSVTCVPWFTISFLTLYISYFKNLQDPMTIYGIVLWCIFVFPVVLSLINVSEKKNKKNKRNKLFLTQSTSLILLFLLFGWIIWLILVVVDV